VLPAFAQESDTSETQDTIVVTGSRIARDEFSAPAPVQVINAEQIAQSGETDIAVLLRETPALNGTLTANDSPNTGAPNGVGTVNLRNLGANRTLALVNGRRHVAGVAGTAAIDTSTIPIALIEQVEVLTGGASAIYGADAVTGVVNFILKDDFEGLDYRVQGGISDEGDAEEYFAAITAGTNFGDDDRGNVTISAEYSNNEPLFGTDRPFSDNAGFETSVITTDDIIAELGLPEGTVRTFLGNVRFPFSSGAGAVDIFADDGGGTFFVEQDGSVRPYDFGQPTGDSFESIGGDGVQLIEDNELIRPDSSRFNVNANFRYSFAQELNLFAETKFVYTDTFDVGGNNGYNDFIPIADDNAFIPAGLRAIADGFTNAGIFVSRDSTDLQTRPTTQSDRYTMRVVTGFEGEFDNGLNYEVSYNYGRTEANNVLGRTRVEDRFFASIDAVALTQENLDELGGDFSATVLRDGRALLVGLDSAQVGDVICRTELQAELGVDVDNPGAPSFPRTDTTPRTFVPGDDTCVPTSILGENAINPGAVGFAFPDLNSNSELTQSVFLALLSGTSEQYFELPAGPVGFALGFEYREETSAFTPAEFDAAGFLFEQASAATSPVQGEFDVSEYFAEVSVPVLKGMAFAQDVTLDGAVRLADYSTVGNTTSWSVGLNWAIDDQVRFRGTYGTAVRAPNIDELFSPRQPDFSVGANDDPCIPANLDLGSEFREANCQQLVGSGYTGGLTARVTSSVGGNPELEEEEATTFTLGGVFEPNFIPGFSLAVDYYNIEIENAIAVIQPLVVAENCVDAETVANSFCEQVDRNPNGTIATIRSGQQNVAALEAEGIDISARYGFDLVDIRLPEWGSMNLSLTANRQLENEFFPFQEFPEQVQDNLGEFAVPKWIVNLNADWNLSDVTVAWQTRWQQSQLLPGIENENLADNPLAFFPNSTGDAFIHDVRVSYDLEKFGGAHTVYAGINNLGDRDPFRGTIVRPAGVVGRFFFVGVNGQF
jgi:outer membrane receptor protein involved in Fe transport